MSSRAVSATSAESFHVHELARLSSDPVLPTRRYGETAASAVWPRDDFPLAPFAGDDRALGRALCFQQLVVFEDAYPYKAASRYSQFPVPALVLSQYGPMAPTVDIVVGPPATLDNTFGAMLVGTFIGLVLYGIVIHQTYRYFRLYTDDNVWLKALVAIVFALETFHIVSSTHICYFYLVSNYYNPMRLLTGVWSINSLTATSGIVIFATQMWVSLTFTPISYVGSFEYMNAPASLLVVYTYWGADAFFSIATAKAFIKPVFADFEDSAWLISAGAGMAQGADMLLTTVLMVVLRNGHTGVKRVDSVLDTLMLYAMNTGMLTSIVNSLSLVFSLLLPKTLVFGATGVIATKLYANSLLAALNARKSLVLRAKYDLDIEWVNAPITPQHAYAVSRGSRPLGTPPCTYSHSIGGAPFSPVSAHIPLQAPPSAKVLDQSTTGRTASSVTLSVGASTA
ncbi:hypothetical protein C8Q76DRAFT_800846 [Earliella scabrosa]|nr:hypothetical protein C8Q76DRAFT_800846 [Earliella scabrosa]